MAEGCGSYGGRYAEGKENNLRLRRKPAEVTAEAWRKLSFFVNELKQGFLKQVMYIYLFIYNYI